MLLSLLLLVVGLAAGLFFWTRSRLLSGVIHFEQSPFFGNWPALLRNMHRLYDWRLEHAIASEAAGRECLQRSGPFLAVLELHSPRMLQYMLHTNFPAFEKGERFRGIFQEFLGNGIFNSDGDQWRSQRKIASHMFSAAKLNNHMLAVFKAHAETVLDLLEEQRRRQTEAAEQSAGAGAGSAIPTIEMQSLFHRYTMDSIMHIGFGVQLDSLKSKGAPPPFVAAFDSMAGAVLMRFLGPPIKYKIQRLLGIKTEAIVARSLPVIDEFVYSICEARKQNQEALEHSGDLLSLFIADAAKGNLKMTVENGAPGETSEMTDQDLRNIVLNFFLAGRDTTASLLTFLFFELSRHPEVEAKVYEEITRVLGEPRDASHASACEGFTHETLKSLVYLEAVILETLRLHPPVAVDTKVSNRATVFPDGTKVPKGMVVSYSPYIFGRLASIWGDDVLAFKPDRFLSPASSSGSRTLIQPSQYSYPQFNAGPRLCLGRGMAIMEAKVLTASILRAGFQLRAKPDHDPAYKLTIILSMTHGLPMTVQRRQE